MGNCWSKSMNPPHHGSTTSSRPCMERSLPSSQDPVHLSSAPTEPSLPTSRDPVPASPPMRNCCSRIKFSGSTNPPHHGSTSSSHPSMERSLPASQDPVPPPSVEASSSRDPVPPSPPMDSIDSVREMFRKRDEDELVELIGPLVNFIENQLQKMNTKSEAGSSSSAGWLATLGDATTLAATVVDTISKEAEKLYKSEIVKGMGNLTLKVMKGLGELHWVFIGLSVAAYAVESYNRIGSTKDACLEVLQKILELAKDVKQEWEYMLKIVQLAKNVNMSDEKNKLCKAVGAIVEGAVICCVYLNDTGNFSRLFSATTVAAKLENTKKQVIDSRDSLSFSKLLQIHEQLPLRLPLSTHHQLLDFQPVGIVKAVGEVKDLLDMEGGQSVLAVIVCGFGGLGKSTLAASVVQSVDLSSRDFKYCRVEIDETRPDRNTHIKELQQQIIYDLGGLKLDLANRAEGRPLIKEALKQKCSLLYIDNVNDKDYIRDLLPADLSSCVQNLNSDAERHQTKLRILITSRQKNVKQELNNIKCEEYDVDALSELASKDLLFKTILQSQMVEDIDSDETRLIEKVAAACKGVPLLLSIFGKHLRMERDNHLKKDTDRETYLEALEDAQRVLSQGSLQYREKDFGTKLMFVYDQIKEVEVQEAFLDICLYFRGWEWNVVADIVDSPKLEDLRSRMLVSKSGSGKVVVHDILQLMGKTKAGLTRFSNYKELKEAFENNFDDFGKVRGMSLVNGNNFTTIQSPQLEAMHQSLRVLIVGDWFTLDEPCCKAFTNLRYLRVGDIIEFPFKHPSKLNKLRVFVNGSKPGMNLSHLPPSLKRISHEVPPFECDKFEKLAFQNLCSLKRFIVKPQNSVELPQELSLPASLVTLDLNRCKNIPKYLGHLTVLEYLIMDGSDLESLPQGFGKLKKLKHLSMNYCSKLAFLSDELGKVSSLEELSMEECGSLTALPDSLGELTSLQTLKLRGSTNLQQLPESFGKLRIPSLELHSLENLHKLPNSFGNMSHLKDLSLISCHSLMSLPNSFVELKSLETLKIIKCTKLRVLPEEFGRLRCLKYMTIENCYLLKELPHGFGALPALKTFKLENCDSFVNLPRDFTELTCLEELRLRNLPLMSKMPDGFGKLKKLRFFIVWSCFQLKTLAKDFENMASLERLWIQECPEVDGAMMEKILKLQNCCIAMIDGSRKLLEKWKDMQSETDHPFVVISRNKKGDVEARKRAIRFALLNGKCMEVNGDKVKELSCLLEGLEEGRSATVALIMLPVNALQPHQQYPLKRFVKTARQTAQENGSDKLQIVCARKVDLHAERTTPTDEDGDIPKILSSLAGGYCIISSSQSKRLKILTSCCDRSYYYSRSLMDELNLVTMVIDVGGCKRIKNFKFVSESDILLNTVMKPPPSEIKKPEDKDNTSIQHFIKSNFSICHADEDQTEDEKVKDEHETGTDTEEDQTEDEKVKDEYETGTETGEDDDKDEENENNEKKNKNENEKYHVIELDEDFRIIMTNRESRTKSKTTEFIEALKESGIHYLLINNDTSTQMMVDDLHERTIGFIICHFKFLECIKLQQICKHFQDKDSSFTAIWIPTAGSEEYGHGTYTRLSQCMPWATFPIPQLLNVENRHPCFVVLDKHGQIANHDALPLIMGWGVESYPVTQLTIPESFSMMESKPCLEFLLHGMNIIGRKPMSSKMTFLYVGHPHKWLKMKFKLEQLTEIHAGLELEVLYVGKFYKEDIYRTDYEEATRNTRWPSLSFSDMIMFWCRCKYLASKEVYERNKESNIMMETLHGLARRLCVTVMLEKGVLALVDNDGVVTSGGYDMLQMLCESSDEISEGEGIAARMVKAKLIESLNRGKCGPLVKTFFRDEIHNLPFHPEHPIILSSRVSGYQCHICGSGRSGYDGGYDGRRYRCDKCDWDMCETCWMKFAKQEAEQLLSGSMNVVHRFKRKIREFKYLNRFL